MVPPFQGGGIQPPSEPGVGGSGAEGEGDGMVSFHIDITGILVGRFQRRKPHVLSLIDK